LIIAIARIVIRIAITTYFEKNTNVHNYEDEHVYVCCMGIGGLPGLAQASAKV